MTLAPHDARALLDRARTDPEFFAAEALGLRLWSRQRELLASVARGRRTAAKGGHASGKSHAAAALVIWFICTRPGSRVVLLSTSFQGAVSRIFGDVGRLVRGARVPLGGDLRSSSFVLGPGWQVEVVAPDDSSGLQGRHSAAGTLVVLDEGQGIAAELWEGAGALVTGEHDRLLALGNPTSLGTPFHRCFTADREAWCCLTFDSEALVEAVERGEEPALPGLCSRAFVEDSARTWGRGSGLFASRVRGEFPTEAGEGLVSVAHLEAGAALGRPDVEVPHLELCVGVDLARFGLDTSCAVLVREGVVADVRTWSGRDLMQSAGRIRTALREWRCPPERCALDSCGLGVGALDALRERGVRVRGCNVAGRPTGAWRAFVGSVPLLNLRAELFLALSRLIERKALIVPSKYQSLWAELSSIRFDYSSSGALKIEDKGELKARIGRSPDHADALALALYRPVVPSITIFR